MRTVLRPLRLCLVVDADPFAAELRACLFGPDGPFVRAATTATAAELSAWLDGGHHADLALVDPVLPGCPDGHAITELRARRPDIACLAHTRQTDAVHVLSALRAGARGYLVKDGPPEHVREALHALATGGAYLSSSIARRMLGYLKSASPDPVRRPPESLTTREIDVLRLLGTGLRYHEIARHLDVALGTVQGHVKRLYAKLEINSKAEATLLAVELGLVTA